MNFKKFKEWTLYGPILLMVGLSFILAARYIQPAPPKTIRIAAGEPGGAYDQFAHQYQKLFKKEGIDLKIIPTYGSVQNIALLKKKKADMALVQGGVAKASDRSNPYLEGLGSLYFEPLWLFHRHDLNINRLNRLKQIRINIGPPGSGTYALAQKLLAQNQLESKIEILHLEAHTAAQQLKKGQIDAAFFVSSLQSPLIQSLLRSPTIQLSSLKRAEAYTRLYPFLIKLVLPEGSQDLALNRPDHDIQLLATTTALVVRSDLHPAIIALMMDILNRVHNQPGAFNRMGQFPTPDHLEFKLNEQALSYYQNGPSFLQKYLPFWAAALIDRTKIMLLPLLGLMFPLFKIVPPVYRWRMRARIYRWYKELNRIEQSAQTDSIEELINQLDQLEEEVRDIRIPLSFSRPLYDLRLHIHLIRAKLTNQHVA